MLRERQSIHGGKQLLKVKDSLNNNGLMKYQNRIFSGKIDISFQADSDTNENCETISQYQEEVMKPDTRSQ